MRLIHTTAVARPVSRKLSRPKPKATRVLVAHHHDLDSDDEESSDDYEHYDAAPHIIATSTSTNKRLGKRCTREDYLNSLLGKV